MSKKDFDKPDFDKTKATGKVNKNKKPKNKYTKGKPVDRRGDYNPPEDYMLDPELAKQVFSYSYEVALGEASPISAMAIGSKIGGLNVQMPTVTVYDLQSTVGNLNAMNQCGLRTYTMLSARNAKTTQYAPQDITMIILALGDIISLHSYIRMVMGLVPLYNVRNRTLPQALIANYLNIDYDDLKENYANYVTRLNFITVQASKIPFPGNIKYFDVCDKLYSCIFSDDGANPMAQLYVPRMYSIWKFNEAYNDKGSGLETLILTDSKRTMGSLIAVLEDAIDRVMNSATLNFVYPDVLRFLENEGRGESWRLPTIEFGHITPVIQSDEFNLQFNNGVIMEGFDSKNETTGFTKMNDVSSNADTNTIRYYPTIHEANGPSYSLDHLVAFDTDKPDLAAQVSATRFLGALGVEKWDATAKEFKLVGHSSLSLPDHVIRHIYSFRGGETTSTHDLRNNARTEDTGLGWYSLFNSFYKFMRFPIFSKIDEATGNTNLVGYTNDPNYYTFLPYHVIENINTLKTYSLFSLNS